MAWYLDTRILKMLIAIAEAPSAAQAAARLSISPSALSHQMRKAEADLRVAIFDRRGHRTRLTSVGEQLYASAQKIIAELEEAESLLDRTRRGNCGTIRVGGGPYPIQKLLIRSMDAQDMARIDIVLRTKVFPLARAVAEGELDLALVGSRVRQRGVAATPLFEDELVAVMHCSHPLAGAPSLDGQVYANDTYISYSRIVEDGLEDDLLFRPTRTAPARFLLAESVEAILDLVEAGLGFSILSRWCIPKKRPGLASIPLVEGGARVHWSVVHRQAERKDEVIALRDRLALLLRDCPTSEVTVTPVGSA